VKRVSNSDYYEFLLVAHKSDFGRNMTRAKQNFSRDERE